MNLLVELARRFPQVSFLWVGGQPADVEAWREHLADENIGNITLTGFVENSQLPLYQAASDILLMPYEKVITGSSGGNSTTYASPMKMFEYMASKRVDHLKRPAGHPRGVESHPMPCFARLKIPMPGRRL